MIDWISYRIPALGKILQPKPLPLIKGGALMRRNMRQEFMTVDELQSQLRKQGISNVSDVKAAYMESDGEISVIPRDTPDAGNRRPARKKPGAK
jgi:uncharacterized membrane protein YcaP (DUF421 family)